MNAEFQKFIESEEFKKGMSSTFNEVLKDELTPMVGAQVAEQMKTMVEKMRVDRIVNNKDISGLTEKVKKDFVEICKAVSLGGAVTKANEAFIEEQDNRGGFLVSTEVAAAILRIAASVGTVMSQAQQWE